MHYIEICISLMVRMIFHTILGMRVAMTCRCAGELGRREQHTGATTENRIELQIRIINKKIQSLPTERSTALRDG